MKVDLDADFEQAKCEQRRKLMIDMFYDLLMMVGIALILASIVIWMHH